VIKKVIERKMVMRHFCKANDSVRTAFMRTRKKTNFILTPVKPIPERNYSAYQPVDQTNKKEYPAHIGIALKAVVNDGPHASTD
jgi:hypothetical protein